uniref:Uncharacterized protein n=1 Tax=Micrococcus phage Kurnik TaxID=3092208 RepID=A0AAU6R5H7_9CAUD
MATTPNYTLNLRSYRKPGSDRYGEFPGYARFTGPQQRVGEINQLLLTYTEWEALGSPRSITIEVKAAAQ